MNPKKSILCFIAVSGLIHGTFLRAGPEKPLFFADMLWSGSLEKNKHIINRTDLKLGVPGLGLILRGQLVDRHPPPWSDPVIIPSTAFGAGLYHTGTGSRLLYGIITEAGPAARLKNIWNRGSPFQVNHVPGSGDLSTAPSSSKQPGGYLYLGSPRWGPVRLFSSVYLKHNLDLVFSAGAGIFFSKRVWLTAEGLYTEQNLPEYPPVSWFSVPPWLPERVSRLYAGSVNFSSPGFGLSGDAGFSQTYARGNGWCGDVCLRLGNRPWRIQVSLDGVSGLFVDPEGSAVKVGIRAGLLGEIWGKSGSYAKLNGGVSGPGFDDPLSKTALSFTYYFPMWKDMPVRPSRGSFSLERSPDGDDGAGTAAGASFSLFFGPVLAVSSFSIRGNNRGNSKAFPLFTDFTEWDSLCFSQELQYRYTVWSFKTKFTYLLEEKRKTGKTPVYGLSFYASAYWSWGRLSAGLNFDNVPGDWSYTINWQLRKNIEIPES